MNFKLNFGIGISLFLVFLISGIVLYSYSAYYPQQQSRYVTVYSVDVNETLGESAKVWRWDINKQPFDTIFFNLSKTSRPIAVDIEAKKSEEYFPQWVSFYINVTNNQGSHYVKVSQDYDIYDLTIQNYGDYQAMVVQGSIDVLRTEYYTAQVLNYPYQGVGVALVVLCIIAGLFTGISLLMSRQKMKDTL